MILEEIDVRAWAGAKFDDDPLPDPLPFQFEEDWLTATMKQAQRALEWMWK